MKTVSGFGLSCFAVALSAVGLADVPNLPFVQDGLVLHVDAQDKDSMTLDDDGYVTSWTSSASPDGNPLVLENADTIAGTYLPYYKAAGVTGKPCVMFGETADGKTKRATVLGKMNANLGKGSVMGVFATFASHGAFDAVFGNWMEGGSQVWASFYAFDQQVSVNGITADNWHLAGFWRNNAFDLIAVDRRDLWNLTDLADTTHNTVAYFWPVDHAHVFYLNAVANCVSPLFGRIHSKNNYYFRGEMNEWLYYNRTLTPFERAINESCLSAKWFDKKITTWVGGASGDWHTAANWSNGVPDSETAAVVPGTVAITISSPASVADFVVASTVGGSLTVNANLTVMKGFGVPSNYALAFGDGVTLALMNERGVTPFPANVTMGATFKKAGSGDVRLSGTIAGTPAFTLDEGKLDLNGFSQTLASLDGVGTVRNGSTTRVLLALTTGEDATLRTRLDGPIDLAATAVKGETTLHAVDAPQGSLALGAKTVVSEIVNPASVPGCVLWLDATATDSLTRDVAGHVTSWRSLVRGRSTFYNSQFACETYKGGNRVVFTNDLNRGTGLVDAGSFGQQPYDRPVYVADALNGKPGVRFGWNADGSAPVYSQLLATNDQLTVRSWFAVFKYKNYNDAYGKFPMIFGNWKSADTSLTVYSGERLNKTLGATNIFASAELQNDNGVTCGETKARGKAICYCPSDTPVVISGRVSVGFDVNGMALGLPMNAGHIANGFSLCGEIGEFIAFDRVLTDRELQIVNKYLMAKWDVEPYAGATHERDARDILPTTTPVSVPAGATVDFEGAPQHLESLALAGDAEITDCALSADALTYAVPASGKTPCLTVGGDMDITETALTFTGAKPNSGRIVKTSGTLTGPFKSVTGAAADKIRYKANLAQFTTGLLLFLR